LGQGGLRVNMTTGAWFWNSRAAGGYSPTQIICQIKALSRSEAVKELIGFLARHEGTGSCGTESTDHDDGPASQAEAARIGAAIGEIVGTPGAKSLESRGLPPPYPETVKRLADARPGDGAIVARLTSHRRTV